MSYTKRKDGFAGGKHISIPVTALDKQVKPVPYLSDLFITHIGYFPKAHFHYRERRKGCTDNILLYCVGGKGYVDLNGHRSELLANQFVILPAGSQHRYQADLKDPWTLYWVHFSGNRLDALNEWLLAGNFFRPREIQYDERIVEAWQDMYHALRDDLTADSIAFASFGLHRFMSFFIFPPRPTRPEKKPDKIQQIVQYMKSNIESRLTVDEMAAHVQLSPSYFSLLFREKNGLSPMEYFIKMKMQYGCQLLTQSPLKVREVADKVGYQDQYFFSRLFRKVTGISPVEYRRKYAVRTLAQVSIADEQIE